MRKKVRLLVVDDHSEFCNLLKEIAEFSNDLFEITCEFTDSGTKAKELLMTWEPSVILVDAHLPDVNSSDLVRQCRVSNAPVVVTSSGMSQVIEDAARKWGASGYVPKSENMEEGERLLLELATMAADDARLH